MGARQALAREVIKRGQAKQTNYDKKRNKLKANKALSSQQLTFWKKTEHFSDADIQ
jgi:hypothetical protein